LKAIMGQAIRLKLTIDTASAPKPHPRATEIRAKARTRSISSMKEPPDPDASARTIPSRIPRFKPRLVGGIWLEAEQAQHGGGRNEQAARDPDLHGAFGRFRLAGEPLVEGGGNAAYQ
jgi:hypothetical protein